MPTEPRTAPAGSRVVLVAAAPPAGAFEQFRAVLSPDVLSPDVRVEQSIRVPSGPDVVALAVAPSVRLTAEQVRRLPGLRIAVSAAAGTDHLDVGALAVAGVPVADAGSYCDVEVADHTIALVASLLRRLHEADAAVRQGLWRPRALPARRISGAVLGVVGLGRIGRLVAGRARALGMTCLAWAPHTDAVEAAGLGVELCDRLPELLSRCDVVSLHLPLTAQTRHILDAQALQQMRPGSYLVNCGRGELVDLDALRSSLVSGHLAGAALDVLDEEPPSPGHAALHAPRTVLTPHMAWFSPQSEFAAYRAAAARIVEMLSC